MKELILIQKELKAPKNQYNAFGGFYYRSLEDILEGLKPLLEKHECQLTIQDEIVMIGERFYVKATATLVNKDGEAISVSAYAREPLSKTKMDDAQITGSSSSYARKYALNGLFLIDDNKDPDALDDKGNVVGKMAAKKEQVKKVEPKKEEVKITTTGISKEKAAELGKYAKELGYSKEKYLAKLNELGFKTPFHVQEDKFEYVLDELSKGVKNENN